MYKFVQLLHTAKLDTLHILHTHTLYDIILNIDSFWLEIEPINKSYVIHIRHVTQVKPD